MGKGKRVKTKSFLDSSFEESENEDQAEESESTLSSSSSSSSIKKLKYSPSFSLPKKKSTPTTTTVKEADTSLTSLDDSDVSFQKNPSTKKHHSVFGNSATSSSNIITNQQNILCSSLVTPTQTGIRDDVGVKDLLKTLLGQNKEILSRLDNLETAMQEKENQMKKKQEVQIPNDVRYHVKFAYKEADKQNLNEWILERGSGAFHEDNQKTTKYIKTFVAALHPDLPNRDVIINSAIKTYYESKFSQKRKHLNNPDKQKEINRNQRRVHKAKRRQKALYLVKDAVIDADSKNQFVQAITTEMMSSEEELENENGDRYFMVHRPKWRTKSFQKLVDRVDKSHLENCSKRAKEQMAPRKLGTSSDRSPPKELKYGMDLFVDKNLI